MMRLLYLPIALLAAGGFLASLVVSISFWLGTPALPAYHDWLFDGIWVVFTPTVLLVARNAPRGRVQFWNEHFRAAPPWVVPAFVAVFAYAIVNFLLAFSGAFDATGQNFARVGSSHAMVFYFGAMALNLAAFARRNEAPLHRCERGHQMPVNTRICPTCGAARAG